LAVEAFDTRVYAKALRYAELAIIKNGNVILEADCTKLISWVTVAGYCRCTY